jgi:hypothetical protein
MANRPYLLYRAMINVKKDIEMTVKIEQILI